MKEKIGLFLLINIIEAFSINTKSLKFIQYRKIIVLFQKEGLTTVFKGICDHLLKKFTKKVKINNNTNFELSFDLLYCTLAYRFNLSYYEFDYEVDEQVCNVI